MTSGSADDLVIAAGCPVAPGGYDAPPVPLGPESLTWKYFGDWRGLLQGLWNGSMQNMHPQLGAGVEEHSTFFRERVPRLMRSLYPIGGVVFDGDRAPRTGAEVRDYHVNIKGVDAQGRRYHALNPDVFYWAHAIFFMGTLIVAERFAGGITEAEKRQLFDEHIRWYSMYGMSMRPVPQTWEDFQAYWDHMCRNVLENNYAARAVLDLTEVPKPPFLPWLPDRLWKLQRKLLGPVYVWLDRRAVRPTGARTHGLHVVVPRRMAAAPVLQRRASGLLSAAEANPNASAGTRRLGPGHGQDPGRRTVGGDAGAQPSTARRAGQPDALLPDRRPLAPNRVAGPAHPIEIAPLPTVLGVREPAGLNRGIASEHTPLVPPLSEPVFQLGPGSQSRVPDPTRPRGPADSEQQHCARHQGHRHVPALRQQPAREEDGGAGNDRMAPPERLVGVVEHRQRSYDSAEPQTAA